ncbi:MAG: hypothetical protein ABSE63_03075 [Thermoguttaceae bacterium]
MDILVSVVVSALVTWVVAHYYYRRTEIDGIDGVYAKRLDICDEGDKTFLIAMLDINKPIPLYACINVEFETQDGRKGSWGSNALTMSRSVNSRAKRCIQHHSGNHIDEDRNMISLNERGLKNAEYLLRKEYKSSRFSMIDDNENTRIGLFRYGHNREPKKGHSDDSGPKFMLTTGAF